MRGVDLIALGIILVFVGIICLIIGLGLMLSSAFGIFLDLGFGSVENIAVGFGFAFPGIILNIFGGVLAQNE